MNVYKVTKGWYDAAYLAAIFSTEEKAFTFAEQSKEISWVVEFDVDNDDYYNNRKTIAIFPKNKEDMRCLRNDGYSLKSELIRKPNKL